MEYLDKKIIIFSNKTGANFDVSVLLWTEDMRQSRLKLWNNVQSFDNLVKQVPF